MLTLGINVGQFPQDDGRCADFDEAVETESRQSNGSGLDRGIGQHEDADDTPTEGGRFELAATAEEPLSTVACSGLNYGVNVSDRSEPPSPRPRPTAGNGSVIKRG